MKKKKYMGLIRFVLASIILVALNQAGMAQVAIGSGDRPHVSADLELKDESKGLLIPRVSLVGKFDVTTVPNPAEGLMVYNLIDADNGTPLDFSDDVSAGSIYVFEKGKWVEQYNAESLEKALTDSKLPQIVLLGTVKPAGSGNDNTFVSNDLGNGIRKYMFDDLIYSIPGVYDASLSEFTAPKSGYYQIKMNILIRPNSTASSESSIILGISKPYTGNFPTSGVTNDRFNNYINILNSGSNAALPAYIHFSTTIFMAAGEKVVPLTKKIAPDIFSLNVDGINYKRETTNRIVITYLPK